MGRAAKLLIFTFLSIPLLFATGITGVACAGQGQIQATPAQQVAPHNPYHDKIRAQALKLSKKVNPEQVEALAMIRVGFGMIRAVSMVHGEVATAVEECSKANPAMAEALQARFSAWEDTVLPVVEENEAEMEEALKGGIFTDVEEDVRAYLEVIDKSADYANEQIEKQVITTPEACGRLNESMGETQETVTRLLSDITWPQDLPAEEEAQSGEEQGDEAGTAPDNEEQEPVAEDAPPAETDEAGEE